ARHGHRHGYFGSRLRHELWQQDRGRRAGRRGAEPGGYRSLSRHEAERRMTAPLDFAAVTMPQALKHHADSQGDMLALREKDRGLWRRYTWREYFGNARLVAIGLYALGFRPGDRLAVAGDDSPQWLFSDLG